MPKPKIPNQRKANLEHKKRIEKYVALIQQVYDRIAKEASMIASLCNPDTDKSFSFSDYPLTKEAIKRLQSELISEVGGTIMSGTSAEWKESNLVQDLVAKKVLTAYTGTNKLGEEYTRYFQTNPESRKAFQQRKDEGMNLSTRVWALSEQYKTELEESITAAIAPGTSAVELASQVKQYLKYPDKRFRRIKEKLDDGTIKWRMSKNAKAYHPGQGIYRSSARNAQRLARTEINMAYRTAEQTRWRQFDFVVGYEVKTTQNGHHVEDICDQLAGKYPKDFKFVGWHPQCMCYCIPILKTEDEFWAYDPENPEKSANEITELPPNFREWIDDNRDRIEAAEKRGKLPYFIRDNRNDVEEILQGIGVIETTDISMLPFTNQYRGNIFARMLDNIQTTLISREFKNIDSFDELSIKASGLLSKAVGNDVTVKIDPELMTMDIAKAHLTELVFITRNYNIKQGKLTEIKIGYKPSNELERGETTYIPSNNSKRVSLTGIIDNRDPIKAESNSRCDKNRLQFSLAAHESSHLLFNFDAPVSGELLFFHQSINKEYEQYIKELFMLFSQREKGINEISIGDYGTVNGIGEFMAECFQEYINSSKPSKYAKRVGRIIDSYFKK